MSLCGHVLALSWADLSWRGWALLTYLVAVTVASVICFAAFGLDKRRAARGGWRVPESTLHLMELLGGWPGALAGQRAFRHKTQKLSYRVTLWAIIVLHALAWAYFLVSWVRSPAADAAWSAPVVTNESSVTASAADIEIAGVPQRH